MHQEFMYTASSTPCCCCCAICNPSRQVVQDRLLVDAEKSAAAFGFGLARGIRRLQNAEGGGGVAASTDRRLLRAAALSVSKALESGNEN